MAASKEVSLCLPIGGSGRTSARRPAPAPPRRTQLSMSIHLTLLNDSLYYFDKYTFILSSTPSGCRSALSFTAGDTRATARVVRSERFSGAAAQAGATAAAPARPVARPAAAAAPAAAAPAAQHAPQLILFGSVHTAYGHSAAMTCTRCEGSLRCPSMSVGDAIDQNAARSPLGDCQSSPDRRHRREPGRAGRLRPPKYFRRLTPRLNYILLLLRVPHARSSSLLDTL